MLLPINDIRSLVFVGNEFMRSERFMNHQDSMNRKTLILS